jgi:proteasome lid subunit RPN8/RPN11
MTDILPEHVLREIAAHARATYPAECCGLVFVYPSGSPRFVPVPNVAGTPLEMKTSSRTVRDGYVMDPTAQLKATTRAEAEGGSLRVIIHSHPDVGAYFSPEDREKALLNGKEPWFPGVDYLVVSCRESGVDDARLYTWDPKRADFQETQVPITSVFR